jgi:hypothetical protein
VSHTCHAHECRIEVSPSLFMCRRHWFSLKKPVRDAVWREYRKGQENDKKPSLRYLAVQRLAVGMTAFRPYDEKAAYVCAEYLLQADRYRKEAIAAGLGDPLDGLVPKQ